MQGDGTRVFRVRAAAEMFDVSPSTIYRAISAGRLDAYKIGPGLLRVPEYALAVFTEEASEAAYRSYVCGGEDPADDDPDTGHPELPGSGDVAGGELVGEVAR